VNDNKKKKQRQIAKWSEDDNYITELLHKKMELSKRVRDGEALAEVAKELGFKITSPL